MYSRMQAVEQWAGSDLCTNILRQFVSIVCSVLTHPATTHMRPVRHHCISDDTSHHLEIRSTSDAASDLSSQSKLPIEAMVNPNHQLLIFTEDPGPCEGGYLK